MKRKTKFYLSLVSVGAIFSVTYLIVFLCHDVLPNQGIRNEGFDPAKLTLATEADFANGNLPDGWSSQNNPSISSHGLIFDDLGQGVTTTNTNFANRFYKYVEIEISSIDKLTFETENPSIDDLKLEFYSNDDVLLESGYLTPIDSSKTYTYQSSYYHRNISYIKIAYENYVISDGSCAQITISRIAVYNLR
ncbi:MAG: hypothetical protein WC366_04635 [Bacilli bacterium]|jgi:hypothetical protein